METTFRHLSTALLWLTMANSLYLDEDTLVASVFLSDQAGDGTPTAWREAIDRNPAYGGPVPHPELPTLPRLLEWMEMASGGRRVLVRNHAKIGTCGNVSCSGSLGSLANDTSDISFFYHHLIPENAIHVDHMWRIGNNDIVIMALKENILAKGEDVLLSGLKLVVGTCLLVMMMALVLAATLFVAKKSKGLKGVAMWYVEILSQQGNSDLWTEAKDVSKFVILGSLFVSVVCLNLFTANLASRIALRKSSDFSLESMNYLCYKVILGEGQYKGLTQGNLPVMSSLLRNKDFAEIVQRQAGEGDKYVTRNSVAAILKMLNATEKTFSLGRSSYVASYIPRYELDRISISAVPEEEGFLNKMVSRSSSAAAAEIILK